MNEADAEKFRAQLLDSRAELETLEDGYRQAGETVELDQTRVGRLSRMDAMQAQQMALEASRRRQLELTAIGAALRRIDAGDYGYCFVCENEIDQRRLAVDPTATRCIDCVERQDAGP
ncbi:MAG: TraR/DksA family transcriptional regulator [Gammaproteobacteria bacterium]|nr:TraR/DksA family transcriptional regulator [Gammaproteobacteria bacterium]